MRKIFILTAFLIVGALGELSAQMELFEGTFQQALEKAKKENKDLFVDFYADWCGPCKMMAAEVFTKLEVGEYFNSRFVCVQIDVERSENKDVVKKYNVSALPTMVFIRGLDGKELRRVKGTLAPPALIREAKIALGEGMSFEQLYEKYKKNKKDLDIQQQLLLDAPDFMMTTGGYERQKWATRIENIFREYLKTKKLEDMMNKSDFTLLTLYHPQLEKEDPIFEFVVANFSKFADIVGHEVVAGYLVGMNNSYIIRLCREGNLAYKERLKRIGGDLGGIYSAFSFGSLSVLDAITLLADATYNLYRHNEDLFFENMNKYFAGKDKSVQLNDYIQALQDLFMVYNGKLSEKAYTECIAWIGKALEITEGMTPELHTRLLIMLGQSYQNTGDNVHAKQCFNQAFLASSQIEDKMMRQQLQQIIQQSLQGL